MGAGGDDGDGRGKLHEHVKAFFLKDDHVESGKTVQSHELINITASTIGKGAFSRIRLVKVKPMNRYLTQLLPDLEASEAALNAEHNGFFAMKVVKKTEVVRLKHVDHVKNESLIHSRVLHPFLATLFHRYQDEKNIYMVMEFVQGGDRTRASLPATATRTHAGHTRIHGCHAVAGHTPPARSRPALPRSHVSRIARSRSLPLYPQEPTAAQRGRALLRGADGHGGAVSAQ